jgi:predicted Zn-dependent peptidase
VILGLLLSIAAVSSLPAAGYRDLERNVVEHNLPNGLKFLLLSRGEAPVFSFCTTVHAGAVDEQYGTGGIAHMMEHMAFKGTKTIGTTDWESEAVAMAREDEAYEALLQERRKGVFADSAELVRLETEFRATQAAANVFVVPNEFPKILDEHGVANLNAGTGADRTMYFYSLPQNKIELWALLESDRMSNPVFREFYQENEVVQEERRMRLESSPSGRLMDEFLSAAFKEHPYGHGLIGTQSDLRSFTRGEGTAFWNDYYVARNMTTAVVGSIDVDRTIDIVDNYFAALPDRPLPPVVDTEEPPQAAERRIIMEDSAQPFLLVAYHIPPENHPDFPAIRAVVDILAGGRSSRLYSGLVKDAQLAVQVGGFAGYPGAQYNTIAFFYAVASAGEDIYSLEQAFHEVVTTLVAEGVTLDELDGYKARAKANFIRQLRSDVGLARQLSYYEEFRGGWRNLFTYLDTIERLTVDDLSTVAQKTFRRVNRTVGLIEPPSEPTEE